MSGQETQSWTFLEPGLVWKIRPIATHVLLRVGEAVLSESGQHEGCPILGIYPLVPAGGYKQNAPQSGPLSLSLMGIVGE